MSLHLLSSEIPFTMSDIEEDSINPGEEDFEDEEEELELLDDSDEEEEDDDDVEEDEFTTCGDDVPTVALDGLDYHSQLELCYNSTDTWKGLPILSIHEKARVLGIRTDQINKGSVVCVEASDFPNGQYPPDSESIALLELEKKQCPIIIMRTMPNGQKCPVSVNELL